MMTKVKKANPPIVIPAIEEASETLLTVAESLDESLDESIVTIQLSI